MKPTPKADYPIHELLLKRWSPRSFSATPVAQDTLNQLLEAARWASSSYNEQPWRFIVGQKGDANYQPLLDALNPFNQAWASSAPVLLVGVAKKTFSANDNPNRHAVYDLGQAMAQLTVQATQEGLYLHQMAGFDPEAIAKAYGLSSDFDVVVAAAIGTLGDAGDLPEQLAEKELQTQVRKPISDLLISL